MAKKKPDPSPDAKIADAVEFREHAEQVWESNWSQMRDDLEFLGGKQWPTAIEQERARDGRPCLTLNRLGQFVDQVIGDSRQNNISLRAIPSGDDALMSGEGGRKIKKSAMVAGLLRNIEQKSNATTHYETALEWAAKTGLGFLRVRTEYGTGMSQDILIESVANPFGVLFDPDTQKPDGSDARRCLILTEIPHKEYKKRYPGAADMSFQESPEWAKDKKWVDAKSVTVAESMWVEEVPDEVLLLTDNRIVYRSDLKDVEDELARAGVMVVQSRKANRKCVYWALINGVEEIEERRKMACQHLPVVPVFGKSDLVDGKTIYRGVIRFAKDAQRQFNYQQSAATERVALSPKAPFMVGLSQADGPMRKELESANKGAPAALFYDDTQNKNPPTRMGTPQIPNAELALAAQAAENLHSTTGIYPGNLGARGNETSGRAIALRQQEGDTGTFAYHDNLARAVQQIGVVCAEMIPSIYDTDRVLRVLGQDGTAVFVRVNQTIVDEQTGTSVKVNDLTSLDCDVVVTTGPAFISQRMEAVNAMIEFTRVNPAIAPVIADVMARNMDWPGAQELSVRLKAMLPPELRNLEGEMDGADPALSAATQQIQAMGEALQQRDMMLQQMSQDIENMKAMAAQTEANKLNNESGMALQAMLQAMAQIVQAAQARDVQTQEIAMGTAQGQQMMGQAIAITNQQLQQMSETVAQMAQYLAQSAQVTAEAANQTSDAAVATVQAAQVPTRRVVEMVRVGHDKYRAIIEDMPSTVQ